MSTRRRTGRDRIKKKKNILLRVIFIVVFLAIIAALAYGLASGLFAGLIENIRDNAQKEAVHIVTDMASEAQRPEDESLTRAEPAPETQAKEIKMESEMQPVEIESTAAVQKPETDSAQEPKVQALLADMSLEEKVAQMFVVLPDTISRVSSTTVAGEITQQGFRNYPVGGIILLEENIVSADQVVEMIDTLQNLSREIVGVPLFVGVDEEGGIVTRVAGRGILDTPIYDSMLSIGETNDEQAAYDVGVSIGSYLNSIHINTDFAPVADVLTNPDNQVIGSRSFGSNPELVSKMVAQEVKGLQENHVYATLKHFPGHGNTAQDSHSGLAYTYKTLEELESCELIPFAAGIEAGATFVMVGHISCPNILDSDVPATLSYTMCTEILREKMQFDGIIFTDAMNMGAICNLYDSAYAAVHAVKAGADMILMPYDFESAYYGVLDAVRQGEITQERIDESVCRILAVKQRMEENEI